MGRWNRLSSSSRAARSPTWQRLRRVSLVALSTGEEVATLAWVAPIFLVCPLLSILPPKRPVGVMVACMVVSFVNVVKAKSVSPGGFRRSNKTLLALRQRDCRGHVVVVSFSVVYRKLRE